MDHHNILVYFLKSFFDVYVFYTIEMILNIKFLEFSPHLNIAYNVLFPIFKYLKGNQY